MRFPLTFACIPLLSFSPLLIRAQETPAGVRYKTASDTLNASAKALLEGALRDPEKVSLNVLAETVTCGPMLWKDLKPSASTALQQSKPIDTFLEIPEVIRTEARAMLTDDQRRSFWSALFAKHPNLKGAKVRMANGDEIRYYWTTIPFMDLGSVPPVGVANACCQGSPDRIVAMSESSARRGRVRAMWLRHRSEHVVQHDRLESLHSLKHRIIRHQTSCQGTDRGRGLQRVRGS